MVTFGIVSIWVLILIANHNPAIFSVSSGTEKLNMSAQGRLQAKIILTYYTCFTMIFVLISAEQPTNMS